MDGIVDVVLERRRLRFRSVLRYGQEERAGQEVVLVQVRTADGRTGLGELVGTPPDLTDRAADDRARVLGSLVGDAAAVDDWALGGAMSTALLDLAGQVAGRTLALLLDDGHHLRPGGPAVDVAVNALLSIGRDRPQLDAMRAHTVVAQGYRTLKLKPVLGTTDIQEHLRAIRASVGPSIALRLDLNGSLSPDLATDWLGALAPIELEYVEQPIAPSRGPAALAVLRAAAPMPIAADEAVVDRAALDALIEARGCDVVVLKPSRLGGPRAAMGCAARAIDAGLGVTVSTMYESGVGLAAALQLAAALPGDRAHGLATADLLADDLIGGALQVDRGRLRVPTRPGLGVQLMPPSDASAGALT